MHLIADASSFLGSVWFGLMLCFAGYIAGHVVSLDRVSSWFKK